MPDPERYNEQSWAEHSAECRSPRRIARLHVYRSEIADVEAMCAKYGATVIGVERMPIIPAFVAEALCTRGEEALALQTEWCEWCETSPHRPRNPSKVAAFNARHNPFPDIPSDWTL